MRSRKTGEPPRAIERAKPKKLKRLVGGQGTCPRKRIDHIRSQLNSTGTGAPSPSKKKRLREELKKIEKDKFV